MRKISTINYNGMPVFLIDNQKVSVMKPAEKSNAPEEIKQFYSQLIALLSDSSLEYIEYEIKD